MIENGNLRDAIDQIRRDHHVAHVVGSDQCLIPTNAIDTLLAAIAGEPDGFDLSRRCAEIVEWRRTGLYRGTELERMAETLDHKTDSEPALSRAELKTIRDALAFLAAFSPKAAG